MADPNLATLDDRPAVPARRLELASRHLREAAPALRFRRDALDVYRALAAPDRVRHLWRFTDPRALLPEVLAEATPLDGASTDATPGAGPTITLRAGAPPLLDEAAARSGAEIVPLGATGWAAENLGAAVPAGHGLFEALNAAAWRAGAALRVPAGATLAAPLRVRVTAPATAGLPRLLVVLERGAEATVVEEHVGGGPATRAVAVTELLLAPGATLRHLLVADWGPGAAGHLTLRARLERNAGLQLGLGLVGGGTAKLDLGSILAGAGARSEMAGVILGGGRQHLDLHTEHDHRAASTWSNLDLRSALADRARAAYTGLIRIEPAAPHSEAYQENRNLLLSRRAHADSIPELEIMTDEVSCTHGATVAPVDPDHLFYLRSRGIPVAAALRLVVRGFLEDGLRQLPATLRTPLEAAVARRLGELTGGGR